MIFNVGDRVLLKVPTQIGTGKPRFARRAIVESDIIRHYRLKLFDDDGKAVEGVIGLALGDGLEPAGK